LETAFLSQSLDWCKLNMSTTKNNAKTERIEQNDARKLHKPQQVKLDPAVESSMKTDGEG